MSIHKVVSIRLCSFGVLALGFASLLYSCAQDPKTQKMRTNSSEKSSGDGTAVIAPQLRSIEVTPVDVVISKLGSTAQLAATGIYSDQSNRDITASVVWKSNTSEFAAVSSTSPTQGLLTAIKSGTAIISASIGEISGSTNVKIAEAKLTAINISLKDEPIQIGTSLSLTAKGAFDDGTFQVLTNNVVWQSSMPTVAEFSDSGSGLIKGLSPGSTDISATIEGVTGSSTLEVKAATVDELKLDAFIPSMIVLTSAKVKSKAKFSNGTEQDITEDAVWASSMPSIASVSNEKGSKGTIRALTEGTANITVQFGGKTVSQNIAVVMASVTAITVSPTLGTTVVGGSVPFAATGTFNNGTTQIISNDVTWSTSVATVASISNAAGSKGIATGLAVGDSQISATYMGKTGLATVRVSAAPQFTLTVNRVGQGTVTSAPAGINCGTTCTASYNSGTSVTLSAVPAAGFTFSGWNLSGCSGTGPCVVVVNANKTVTANFTNNTYSLTVSKVGSGTVTSNPASINCGATCSASFNSGTSVTLSAVPAAGYSFTGWSGSGCSGAGTCVVPVNANTTVTATFTLNTYSLTVSKVGSGTVTSNPASINCGATCSASFNSGTSVTLSAVPAAGYSFTGWSGSGCSGAGTCVVPVNANTTVTATFTLNTYTLTVNKTGSGTVTSTPATINCGTTCAANFNFGASVTLAAVPATGFQFTGWSGGGCSGTGNCVVAINANTTINATFIPITYSLMVSKTGSGTVTSVPANINCGTSCTATFNSGTSVTLSAVPAAGFKFTAWSGGGCSGTGACVVAVNANTSVSATFTVSTNSLTIAKNGSGTVTSTPASINCGTICTASFNSGTSITLSASPSSGFIFSGWSGGGCSGTGTCVVVLNANTTINATFTATVTRRLNILRDAGDVVCRDGYWRDDANTLSCACNNMAGNIWAGCTWNFVNPGTTKDVFMSEGTKIKVNGTFRNGVFDHMECNGSTFATTKIGTEYRARLTMDKDWSCKALYRAQ